MAEYVEPLRVLHALDLEFYGEHITMTLTILTSTFAALSILLVMIGVGALRSDKTVSQRLDVYLAGESTAPITLEELELSRPFSERVIVPLIKRAARLFGWMWPQNRINGLRTRLAQAGN